MSTKVTPIGYLVMETCEDYEQVLALSFADDMPADGILTWPSSSGPHRTAFPTREMAKQAIERTEHYRLAFGYESLPEKKFCHVVRLSLVEPAESAIPIQKQPRSA